MSLFPADIIAEAEALVRDFTAAGIMVSTAESCTGGLIAGALTEIAGSSAVVDRGFVTYTNNAKMEMLGVQEATLARHGAVSEETARQMVHGALFRSHADIAIAVTGVAGPGGGSAEKPVGLVHLAAKSRTSGLVHRKMLYGDLGRDQVRLATVRTALAMMRQLAQT
jgi:nicotinamide-nucleotide amidase